MSYLLTNLNKQTVRGPINELDKCTVVSIFPIPITSVKETLQPRIFEIPAGTFEKPALLHVGSGSWWARINDESPLLEVIAGSPQIAKAIVNDYCNGLLECDGAGKMPGLFWLKGEVDLIGLKSLYKNQLEAAKEKQKNWFAALVRRADIDWARSNGNPNSISALYKLAAQELSIKDKPWMKDFSTLELVACPGCGTLKNDLFPICPTCKTITNMEQYKKLGLGVAV